MMNHCYRGLLLLHCVAALMNVAINLLVLSVSHLKPGFELFILQQNRTLHTEPRLNMVYVMCVSQMSKVNVCF